MKSLLTKILALLGFSLVLTGCPFAAAYGTPYSEFEVNGKVTTKDNKPIEGVRVILGGHTFGQPDTTYTNSKGKYQTGLVEYIGVLRTQQNSAEYGPEIRFEGVKGDQNTENFETQTFIDFEYTQTKKDKGWFCGRFESTVDIKLEEK